MKNLVVLTGRLTKDVTVFDNKDGSKTVMVNIAIPNSFKNSKGERESQFIQAQGFVKKDAKGLGPYEYMHKGDLVSINAEMKSSQFVDAKTKKTVYAQYVFINSVDLLYTSNKTKTDTVANTSIEAAPETAEPVMDAPSFE